MSGIEEVARAAGVSTSTVSRALSGRGRISAETRERVRTAAARLGYVVSSAAATLASGRTQNIGVVVPLLDRWFFATVLDGIASVLAPHGYDITLYALTDDAEQRRGVFETSLRRGRVDGVIVLSGLLADGEVADLRGLGLPVVSLGLWRGDLPTLRVDDTAVGRVAAEHLIALGHRDLAHIGHAVAPGSPSDPECEIPTRRRRGFEAAAKDAGIGMVRFGDGDFTIAGGHRAALALLRQPNPPTAIFAASDEMAYGALAAARELGLTLPRDLSVIGVDGHDLAALFDLTTIDQFPHAQGEKVAEAILARLGASENAAPDLTLPFELVVRASTGPVR
ncbi:MAG: LacI family DNA-binding transcriptional regulator [Microbacterium sp.]